MDHLLCPGPRSAAPGAPVRAIAAAAVAACSIAATIGASGCSEYGVQGKNELGSATDDPALTTSPDPTSSVPDASPPTTGIETETDPDAPPIATAPMYANASTTLYELDAVTLQSTSIGKFTLPNGDRVTGMVDIAIDLGGRMFGTTFDALYRVDPTTAGVERVCDMGLEAVALAFTSDGRLFAGANDRIATVDTVTCALDPLVTGSPYVTSGDLVGLPDGFLYWAVLGRGSDVIVRVDPTSGGTVELGEVGSRDLYGLGYDEDELYGFSARGTILAIDPATAVGVEVQSNTPSWWGATTNPVVWLGP